MLYTTIIGGITFVADVTEDRVSVADDTGLLDGPAEYARNPHPKAAEDAAQEAIDYTLRAIIVPKLIARARLYEPQP